LIHFLDTKFNILDRVGILGTILIQFLNKPMKFAHSNMALTLQVSEPRNVGSVGCSNDLPGVFLNTLGASGGQRQSKQEKSK